jgi:hypothetical protein
VRATDGLQTTITTRPVSLVDRTVSLELSLDISLPMPSQDEHLPDRIEAHVHEAGLEVQRRLFQVLIEKADQELVLQRQHGKGNTGIQVTGLVDDDSPFDDSEEAQAEWIATGFPGCEPAPEVKRDEPRAVDEGFVIVESDEVKTKAQRSTGR